MRNWLLPEYIEDILPLEAERVERIRRIMLDLLRVHGYQLVIPPLLEYLESLITGAGHDLDLATFKVVDLLSGRLMGVRADITPQAARIDAHLLNRQGVTRLCYAGSVLRTRPDGLAQTRQPIQIGAEIFGHAGIESDIEIQQLLVKAMLSAGTRSPHVDFSHVGIFRSLVKRNGIVKELAQELSLALQSKDKSTLNELMVGLGSDVKQALLALTDLNGGIEVLDKVQQCLPEYPEILAAVQDLRLVADSLTQLDVAVSFDLSELRGYRYHSGMVFAAYADGFAGPLALGGRYDEVGASFGRARPATGFSLDLRGLLTALSPAKSEQGILAPFVSDGRLTEKIAALRNAGEIVIQDLPGHAAYRDELNCDRALINRNGSWEVASITEFESK